MSKLETNNHDQQDPWFHEKKDLVWNYIVDTYLECNQTLYKLNNLAEKFNNLVTPVVQSICSTLINENKLITPSASARSRVIVYEINIDSISKSDKKKYEEKAVRSSYIAEKKRSIRPVSLLPKEEIIHVKKPKSNHDVSSSTAVVQTTVNKKSTDVKQSQNINHSYMKENDLNSTGTSSDMNSNKSMSFMKDSTQSKSSALTAINKTKVKNHSNSISDILLIIIEEIRSDAPNPDTDLAYASRILPRCIDKGIKEDQFHQCLDMLMEENKIYVDNDEIFIM